MAISEKKIQIVIDNYFKSECNVDTSIRDAFEKGFRIGVNKTVHRAEGEWVIRENGNKECSLCRHERQDGWDYFCGYCGAYMRSEKEYLDKTFPEHNGGEWFDITDMMTREGKE